MTRAASGPASTARTAHALHLVHADKLDAWLQRQPAATTAWLAAHGFDGTPGSLLVLPDADGGIAGAVIGIGDPLDPSSYGHAPQALPAGDWQLEGALDAATRAALQLGWGLGAYRYGRFRGPSRAPARLLLDAPDAETADLLAACLRVRDLVNTPTDLLGPAELEQVIRDIGAQHDASVEATVGDALLTDNFPAIHAVGRAASHRAPRLITLRWGDPAHPHVALVGKGVCFDTGGLNIKVGDGMRQMKKDMGGAAHAIALAELIMARRMPLRLTLLVPAVENAVGPDSYRPGDVIAMRQGVRVEIDNTDAEGRLVLADALAYAVEQAPALLLDFATLTGAARTALGPELPALYANDEGLANQWLDAGRQTRDPLWRMPLWRPYLRYLTSHVADLANSGPSKMAGSISAALFLECFVPPQQPWAHLDVYSWNDSDRPGHPVGGEAQGLRAAYAMLQARFSH
jgi:leucyl aminopeptidase